MKKVEVTLFGANGNPKTIEVNARSISTQHVKTRLNPANTEPLAIMPNPEPVDIFTESTLIEIIGKMTELDNQDGSRCEGWLCEDGIYKVARINLKHNITAPQLRKMLTDLTRHGVLEHKIAYGLNKFRLKPNSALRSLLMEVDAILQGGVENA